MKPRRSDQRTTALTLVEVLVIVAVLVIMVVLLLPVRPPTKPLDCIANLGEISLAFRVWADENNGKYPMEVSVTNGGTMELASSGNVVTTFQIMSNELVTPRVLHCPADARQVWSTNFSAEFDNSCISYFIGLKADTNYPQVFLAGDDNFAFDGIRIKPGLLQLSTNTFIGWSSGRHVSPNSHFWAPAQDRFIGNILFADGSVQQFSAVNLRQALQRTGLATNRLAIP